MLVGQKCQKKNQFFYLKKICLKNTSKTIILNNFNSISGKWINYCTNSIKINISDIFYAKQNVRYKDFHTTQT